MRKYRLLFVLIGLLAALSIPVSANAEQLSQFSCTPIGSEISTSLPLRSPMPYTKSFTASTTVRSVSTGGFVYIYLRVTATIDGQTNRVISANSVSAYQQDVSRNFVKWQQTGIEKSFTSNSVYGKVKGYCYFKDSSTGVAEKKPFTFEKRWYV